MLPLIVWLWRNMLLNFSVKWNRVAAAMVTDEVRAEVRLGWEPLVRIAIGRRRSCGKAEATEQVSLKASER